MAYNFPSSPAVDDTFTPSGGPTWTWNGTVWVLSGGAGGGGEEEVTGGHITIGPTPPDSPAVNDVWIDTT